MKFIQNSFNKYRRHFEAGGRFHRMEPLFGAMDNFFFSPATATTGGPHIRDRIELKRFMSMVIVALLPCVFASFYFFGWRVLPVIMVSYIAGGAVEVIFAIVRKEEINEGFLVTGLLFPLILPPGIPLWMVTVGVVFGVIVGKEVFGGTGRNLFNPAILGRCFLALAYPAAMSGNWIAPGSGLFGRFGQYVSSVSVDAVSSATPLVLAKRGELEPLWDLFVGHVSGSIGETSALAIILGGMFLLLVGVANWRTVAGALISFFALAAALHLSNAGRFANPVWHLCAGGILFGAFFMTTDPVTCPVTSSGKWLYGVLIGTITVLIRNFTGYVEGMMFAILLGNIAAPILDEIVIAFRLRKMNNE
jgi:Na(+)-translocating NADH:ubiquinone oxidoreductase B subunit